MKKTILLAIAIVLAWGGIAQNCHLTVQLDGSEQQEVTAALYNKSTGDKIGTAKLEGNLFHFDTEVTTPFVAYIRTSSRYYGYLVAEPGNIYYNLVTDSISGTPLNEKLGKWLGEWQRRSGAEYDKQKQISTAASPMVKDKLGEELKEIEKQNISWAKSSFSENKQSIMGAIILGHILGNYSWSLDEVKELMQGASSVVTEYPPVKQSLALMEKAEATAVGKKYTDLALTDFKTGKQVKLSKYIKGKIALVDFWASWCRPCRAEIPYVAEIYKKYGKQIVVISLNVWDKPDAQAKAIRDMKMDWIQLTDDTQNSTDKYGIEGIPHIMLIGADGTILNRDLRGEEMERAVINALK